MKEVGRFLSNDLSFLFSTSIMAGIGCSLWMQLFGDFPSPSLWITTLVFWSLYRRLEEGAVMVYLLTILLSTYTAIQWPLLLLCNMTVFAVLSFIRQRIYTSGSLYFMLLCGGASFCFYLVHFVFSWVYDSNPITSPAWFYWLLEPLWTMLASFPLFILFRWFDKVTSKELPKEMEVGHEF